MTAIESPTLARNLEALRPRQPDLAATVAETPVPADVAPATGRDGIPTFLIRGPDGRQRWFGGSSMPTISADALVAGFQSDGRGVCIPGIFTGVEPRMLLERTPPHAAVFVLEPQPLALKLALSLHDYTSELTRGRLVLIPGEGPALIENLKAFFDANPGYEFPVHLVTAPQLPAQKLAETRRLLEHAGQAVTHAQTQRCATLVETISADPRSPSHAPPATAVVSADPGPAAAALAGRLDRALARADWPHALSMPDRPDACHLTTRLAAIAGLRADLVICVNTGGPLSGILPESAGIGVVRWLTGDALISANSGHPHEHTICASISQHAALLHAGVPVHLVRYLPPAADATLTAVDTVAVASGRSHDTPVFDAAVIMDLPDDRSQSCGIGLPSHVSLWDAVREVAALEVDRRRADPAKAILAEARRRTGTTLQESAVRDEFLQLIRHRAIPAAIGRAAARALVRAGLSVCAWGRNWSIAPVPKLTPLGEIPTGPGFAQIVRSAPLIILPAATPRAMQHALDALLIGHTAGRLPAIALREPPDGWLHDYPGLEDVAPALNPFGTSAELVDGLAAISRPSQAAQAAAEAICNGHTVFHRLQQVAELVRRTDAAATTA